MRGLTPSGAFLRQQPALRLRRAPADPAAQLVELGDAEAIGVEDHHHRGVRDVDADLDHRRGDEHVELAGAEATHHVVLLAGLHPPVEEAEAQPAQLVLGEAGERLLGRRHLELLGVLDQRADDVGLATGGDLGAHGVPRQRLIERADGTDRLDRRAPRRQLVEDADVEVAVHGHRRRARDRRRRHHEDVGHGFAGLVAQGGALFDAEAVLLVDDDDAEAMEVDRRLDQGVGADDDVDRAGGEIGEQLLAGVAGDLVGEQLDAQRAIAEEVVGVGDGEVGERGRAPTAGAVRRGPRSAPSGRPGCPTARRPAAP